jgi:hypothetical protein
MIKKLFFIILLSVLSSQTYSKESDWMKTSGWKNISIFAKMNGAKEKDMKGVMPKTIGAYWAGRITEFYWKKGKNIYKNGSVKKVRVRVTWSSDKGKACGSIVILPINGYKDFNFRSIAMKKCS